MGGFGSKSVNWLLLLWVLISNVFGRDSENCLRNVRTFSQRVVWDSMKLGLLIRVRHVLHTRVSFKMSFAGRRRRILKIKS